MKNLILPAILITMTGCLSLGEPVQGLDTLSKKNISEAFKALGYPEKKEELKNETLYYWTKVTTESFNTYRCTIIIAADSTGNIINTSCQGDFPACRQYGETCTGHLKAPESPLKQPAP